MHDLTAMLDAATLDNYADVLVRTGRWRDRAACDYCPTDEHEVRTEALWRLRTPRAGGAAPVEELLCAFHATQWRATGAVSRGRRGSATTD
ncbi:hypothetical protein [Demequina iriomotensis]|uniref:hypothetical protein n=1 Tax=Demequina iriomotensis TaxID=1536641 RepID=UPI00078537A0|nr:hypothetical protein [Demequina iriomotensis]